MGWFFGHRAPALVVGSSVWSPRGFARGRRCWDCPGWAEVAVGLCRVLVVVWDLSLGFGSPFRQQEQVREQSRIPWGHSGSQPSSQGDPGPGGDSAQHMGSVPP